MKNATVTISLEELDVLRRAREDAERRASELEGKLTAALIAKEGEGFVELQKGFRSALAVVQWSMGVNDPETVRGWPHAKLREVLDAVEKMPGANVHELEWLVDARHYANWAETIEAFRKEGRQQELAQIPRSALGGPGGGAYVHAAMTLLKHPPQVQEHAQRDPEGAGGDEPPNDPPAAA